MASRSVNKVILLGHLGRDAETKFTPGGAAVTKFSVATNRRWKDQQSGEWKEETDWTNIVLWRSENLTAYLTKGKQVYVEGRIQSRSYDDKDGKKVYSHGSGCGRRHPAGRRWSGAGGGPGERWTRRIFPAAGSGFSSAGSERRVPKPQLSRLRPTITVRELRTTTFRSRVRPSGSNSGKGCGAGHRLGSPVASSSPAASVSRENVVFD